MLCGVVESAVEHGQLAGRLARRILEGTPAGELPVKTAVLGRSMVNLTTARQLGIQVGRDLIEATDVVVGEMHADAPAQQDDG
jgi:ABC-type uncharacterized transport system substrate-binding protein